MMSIVPIQCRNAPELLDYLDPSKLEEGEGFYFRGQADASWDAIPSIWRNQTELYKGFIENLSSKEYTLTTGKLEHAKNYILTNLTLDLNIVKDWIFYIKFENTLLKYFYQIANTAGLYIPKEQFYCVYHPRTHHEYGYDLIKTDVVLKRYLHYISTERANVALSMCDPIVFDNTLPQHYHLPTRLLDFTTNPRKAAFFAAYNYLHLSTEKDKTKVTEIAVYAIKEKIPHNPIKILNNHPHHENNFLHAQAGVFVQIYGDFYYLENGKWPSLEDLYKIHGEKYFEIKKYTLPVTEISNLLNRLENCEISISTMMPNYRHVSEQIVTMLKNNYSTGQIITNKTEHTPTTETI